MKWIKSGEASEADLNKELKEYNGLMTSVASLSESFISEIGKAKDADLDTLEAKWDTYWQKVTVATTKAGDIEKRVYSEANAFKKKAQAAYDKAKDIAYKKQEKKDKKEKESSRLSWNKKNAEVLPKLAKEVDERIDKIDDIMSELESYLEDELSGAGEETLSNKVGDAAAHLSSASDVLQKVKEDLIEKGK